MATVTGSAAQLRTRLYRPRPVRLAAQEDTGLSPATGTDDPRTLAQHALGQGEYREAAFRVGRWLADDREDPDAWLAAARVQSRTGPIPGLLPDALAATERILRDRDAGGPVAPAAPVPEAATPGSSHRPTRCAASCCRRAGDRWWSSWRLRRPCWAWKAPSSGARACTTPSPRGAR